MGCDIVGPLSSAKNMTRKYWQATSLQKTLFSKAKKTIFENQIFKYFGSTKTFSSGELFFEMFGLGVQNKPFKIIKWKWRNTKRDDLTGHVFAQKGPWGGLGHVEEDGYKKNVDGSVNTGKRKFNQI